MKNGKGVEISDEVRELLATSYEGEEDLTDQRSEVEDPKEDLPPPVEEITPDDIATKVVPDLRIGFRGWDDVSAPKPSRHPNPNVRRNRTIIGDIVGSGHGFRMTGKDWKPAEVNHCRYCGVDLPTPYEETPCEFHEWPMTGCRCNGCVVRENKLRRTAGRPQEVCGSEECRKARQRERQRQSRARRKAALAAA